jgi:mannose-6-phosphate isomerase-like protein (cupin superfamily)
VNNTTALYLTDNKEGAVGALATAFRSRPLEWSLPNGTIIEVWLISHTEELWRVMPGMKFQLETHKFGHTLTVEKGSGVLEAGGRIYRYSEGLTVCIPSGMPHRLMRVDAETIIRQENWPSR